MARIILPNKWTSQPQYPVGVKWSNPLAPRSGIWIPNQNLVSGKGITFAGSGSDPTASVIRSGKALYSNGKYVQTDNPATAFSVLTWLAIIKPDSAPSTGNYSSFFQTSQVTFNWNHAAANYQGAFTINNGGAYPKAKFTSGFTAGEEVVVGGTYDGVNLRVYRNGILENTVAAGNSLSGVTVNSLQFLGGSGGTGAGWGGSASLFYWDQTKAISSRDMADLSANVWQVLQAQPRKLWAVSAAGGGADLAADAAAQAAAAAALATAIPIAGAALGIGTATAALTTAIPLAGVAASVASGSGALTAQVRISAAALAQAVSSAALSSGIILTAAAVAQAAAAGTLSAAIQLIASAAVQASASAGLTAGGSGLAANAQASASATAALTIQIQLSAAALAQATASASLTAAGSGLSASASALSTAQGSITAQIKLNATALAEAIAVGGLTARIDLSANAITTTSASAWLLTAVRLAADASVISTAAASLTGGSLSVVRYQALTADAFPVALTADAFPVVLTAEVF